MTNTKMTRPFTKSKELQSRPTNQRNYSTFDFANPIVQWVICQKYYHFLYIIFTLILSCNDANNNTHKANVYIKLSLGEFHNKHYETALININNAIDIDSSNAKAYYYRALINFEKLNIDSLSSNSKIQIMEDCIKTLELDSHFDSVFILLVPLIAEQSNSENAIKALNIGLSKNKNSSLLFGLRGILNYGLDDFESSEGDLDKCIILNPNADSYFYLFLAKSKFRVKKYKKAIGFLDQALKMNKNEIESYFWKGASYSKLNMPKFAIENYSITIMHDDLNKTKALQNRGIEYNNLNLFNKALNDFDRAICIDNSNISLHLLKAETLIALGRINQAIIECNYAIGIDNSYANSYLKRGNIYRKKQSKGLACKDFKLAANLGSKQAKLIIKDYCD